MYRDNWESRQFFRSLLIASILILVAAYLWWSYTLFAVLLVIGSLFFCVQGCCQGDSLVTGVQMRTRKKMLRLLPPDEFSEDIDISFDAEEDIPLDIPLDVLEGVDPFILGKLEELDITYLADLIESDPHVLADLTGISLSTIKYWITDAKVMLKCAGLIDLYELSNASPESIMEGFEVCLEHGLIRLPNGYRLTIEKVEHWISAAKDEITRLGLYDR